MDPSAVKPSGDALFPAGQAFTVQRVFRDMAGVAVDLTGRAYVLTFFGGGFELKIGATIAGTVASFPVSSANTSALYAAQVSGKLLQWQIVEQVGGTDGDFVFGPKSFRLTAAGAIAAALGAPAIPASPVFQFTSAQGAAVVTIASMGAPGVAQWQALGFDSAAAYDAKVHADAVAAVLAATGPIDPTHGISAGGETTIPAPAAVPADKPSWVAVYINGIRQRPGAYTSDGTTTLTLAGPLLPQVEWIVEQLQRNPA